MTDDYRKVLDNTRNRTRAASQNSSTMATNCPPSLPPGNNELFHLHKHLPWTPFDDICEQWLILRDGIIVRIDVSPCDRGIEWDGERVKSTLLGYRNSRKNGDKEEY